MLVMVGLVAVVLVIAGAGSLILTRNAARNQAQQQLVSEAESLTSSKAATQRLDVLAAIRKTLKLEDADLITITASATSSRPSPTVSPRRTSTWRDSSRGRPARAARAASSTPRRR